MWSQKLRLEFGMNNIGRSVSLLLVVAASDCGMVRTSPLSTIPSDRALPPAPRRPSGPADASARDTKKRVTSKREPITLFAADQTQCIVDVDDFRRIQVGDEIACVWSPVGRQ